MSPAGKGWFRFMRGVLFLMIVLMMAGQGLSQEVRVNLGGAVSDALGHSLPGMRVEILVEEHSPYGMTGADGIPAVKICYTDKKGRFLVSFPAETLVRLTVCGPGYKRSVQKLNVLGGTNQADYPVSLEDNVLGIEPGSREQAELYVSLVHRQAIDKFLERGDWERIGRYLENKLDDPWERRWGYRLSGHLLLDLNRKEAAAVFLEKGESGWYANLRGEEFMKQGDTVRGVEWFSRGETSWNRALNLYRCAERLAVSGGEPEMREKVLDLAERAYKQAMSSYFLDPFLVSPGMMGKLIELERIESRFYRSMDRTLFQLLESVAGYCATMEKRSVLYTCREKKSNDSCPALPWSMPRTTRGPIS